MMEAVLSGASLAELSQKTGHSHRTLRKMLANYFQYAPPEHQIMAQGLCQRLLDLAFADLLHWRGQSRLPRCQSKKNRKGETIGTPDYKYVALCLRGYHQAFRVLLKLCDMASPPLTPSDLPTPSPLTTEELRQRLLDNPELAKSYRQLVRELFTGVPMPDGEPPI